ncbi:ABC transporter permease [Phytomonospora sp. NPDC050363]|uniref:ABC transporter permease n=1 Tax=Phytomonospora sp. NPDC050363 TaxID=3155642 RepID=UPI0034014C37
MTGTLRLLRLVLRRERVLAPLWILLLGSFAAGQAGRYAATFTSDSAIADFAAEMAGNKALLAFSGQVYSPTLPGMTVWKIADTVFVLIGLVAVLTVVRHTRAEEDGGRAELLGAGAVGRAAPLSAALLFTWSACALTGLVAALGMMKQGFDAEGSIAFGLAVAAVGIVFAAVAALAAQLTDNARGAVGLAGLALAVGYVLRFLADGGDREPLKWFSPQGWSHLVKAYAGNDLTPLALSLALTTAATTGAYALRARRDLGAGLIAQKSGPADGRLRSPLALAWRVQRGLLTGWLAGITVAGIAFGSLATAIPGLAGQGASITEFFDRYAAGGHTDLVDTYLWLMALSLGYVTALYPLLAVLRMRAEETGGRAELLLAGALSRTRWAGGHLLIAAAGSAAILTLGGLAMGAVAGDPWRVLGAVALQTPAVWATASVGVLAFGLLPKATGWICWGVFLFVNLFGEILGPIVGIPYSASKTVIPFLYLPKVISGGDFTALPVLALAALAVLFTAAGVAGLRRRAVA